mgnify:CR=1 FL=1
MRQRRPSPVRPFDVVPPSVVDAAKRLFEAVRQAPKVGLVVLGGVEP